MKKNIGTIDKFLRVVIAMVIAILYYFGLIVSSTLAAVILVVAAVLLITSLLNFCPLYFIFGLNSCSKDAVTDDD